MSTDEYIAALTAIAQQTAAELVALNSPDLDCITERYAQSDQPAGRILAKEIRLARERRHMIAALMQDDTPITVSSPWPGMEAGTQERTMKKVKIAHTGGRGCDGSITDAETGEEVKWVSRAEIVIDANAAAPSAVLHIENVALDFTGDATCVSTVRYDPDDTDSIDQAIAALQAERERRMRQ